MYVRKNPWKDGERNRQREETILKMEDYCSVLLFARAVREADGDLSQINKAILPLVRRGGLANMPEEVCLEFDRILQRIIETLEVVDKDPMDFMNKLESGDVDPVGEVVNAPEVTQALGNVMLRKLRLTDGLRGEAAYAEAKRLLPKVKTELTKFIGEFIFTGLYDLAMEAKQRNIPLSIATKILEPRVTHIASEGIGFETRVDVSELQKYQEEQLDGMKRNDDPGWMHG